MRIFPVEKHLPGQSKITGEKVQGHYIQGIYPYLFGSAISKSWTELFQLEAFLNRYQFKQIIELGTGTGFVTSFLAIHCFFKDAQLYTFDIKPVNPKVEELFNKFGVLSYLGDVFTMETRVIERIKRQGRSLLYCDGGNKKLEAETWGTSLKIGDIMLIHDFDNEVFQTDIDGYCSRFAYDILDKDWFTNYTSTHIALIKK